MKVVSSRDFNQDVSQAKRFARAEPVFVTDRGKPTHVLMSIDAFRALSGEKTSIVDMLAMPSGGEADPQVADARVWDRHEAP